MSKYKVGDKVRFISKDPDFTYVSVGSIGTVTEVESEGYTGRLPVNVDFGEHTGWPYKENIELVNSKGLEADTIYLSGTPGQLEGFRQDWVKAGGYSTDSPLVWEDAFGNTKQHYLKVEFGYPIPRISTQSTSIDVQFVPIMENWQALLDRAAKHVEQQVKCPVKIAGREVEYKEGLVQIGCRKKLTPTSIKELVDVICLINNEGAGIVGLQLHDSHELVDLAHLAKLDEWLSSKK